MYSFYFKIFRYFDRVNSDRGYWAYLEARADNITKAHDLARVQARSFGPGYYKGPYAITSEEYHRETASPRA